MREASAEVRFFKDKDAVVKRESPAIGMSVVTNLDGNRQATLQCFVAQEDGEMSANDLLDLMFRISDRQKARYELVEMEKELSKLRKTLAQFDEDRARLDIAFETEQARRKIEGDSYVSEAENMETAAYEEHVKTGRRGDFKPKGYVANNIERAKSAARKVADDIAKAKAEHDQAIGNLDISRKRYIEEIERVESGMAIRKALLHPAANDPEPDGA